MGHDIDVLVIGAGMSGIGIGVNLIQSLKTRNFEIIEKSNDLGGTWRLNTYPGCGCDVPSHFYSYSFALNPNWSHVYAMQPEIHKYFADVAQRYDIPRHVRYNLEVLSASWDETSATWLVNILDSNTKQAHQRRCKILISAVGALSVPKRCEIQGAEAFQGRLFHSAQWDHSFDWQGKEVVAIGNGCSATQFVPEISTGPKAVKKVTQFSRQAHWLTERPNPAYSPIFKWALTWIPGFMRTYRFALYWQKEKAFSGFKSVSGERERMAWTREAKDYIRKTAPPKYVDALIPRTVVGCKRRVNDTGYLDCLHQDNVELVQNDQIRRILPDGIETKSGRHVKADAIVLATGFETQKPLFPMDIRGEGNVSLVDHWNKVSDSSASAYFGTCLSRFPNFFIMMGPNTVTGHLSVIYTVECQINFTMRVIAPILASLNRHRHWLPSLRKAVDRVAVTPEAEARDIEWTQSEAKKMVWASGCTSWAIDDRNGRNTAMYPDWQYNFWLRSVFIPWKDFEYSASLDISKAPKRREGNLTPFIIRYCALIVGVVGGVIILQRPGLNAWVEYASHSLLSGVRS